VVGGWPPLFWRHLHVAVHHAHLFEPRDWTLPIHKPDGSLESSASYQLRHWPWRTVYHFVKEIRTGLFPRSVAFRDLFWFALVWSIPFWIDWRMALWLWVLPHWCANCITLNRGMYVQHAGCARHLHDRSHPHSNDFLTPFFNRTMFHIGYHGEHHDSPGTQWAELPDYYKARAAKAALPATLAEETE
jgi:fatty acid desaturase